MWFFVFDGFLHFKVGNRGFKLKKLRNLLDEFRNLVTEANNIQLEFRGKRRVVLKIIYG
jgi:hypothetical protein